MKADCIHSGSRGQFPCLSILTALHSLSVTISKTIFKPISMKKPLRIVF